MSLESAIEGYPKEVSLKNGCRCLVRPLQGDDELLFHRFFLEVPEQERMFIKHRVTDPDVIHSWCSNIDLGRHLPLLALSEGRIIADATLHQQLGGWKRHIGRVSVLVHPAFRGQGLARALVTDIAELARQCGLEKLEAEFIGKQEAAQRVFGMLGFAQLLQLSDYVKDMQAVTHDYVLMGMNLTTEEEFAGVG